MSAISYVWLIVLAALAAIELLAIRDPTPGDTLSEHWWWLRDNLLVSRVFLFASWTWLYWHFLFGRPGWYGWPDAAAIAAGILLALTTWWLT